MRRNAGDFVIAIAVVCIILWQFSSKTNVTINNLVHVVTANESPTTKNERCPSDSKIHENAANWKKRILTACKENSAKIQMYEGYNNLGYQRMAYVRKEWKVVYYGIHKNGHTSIQVYLYYWNALKRKTIEGLTAKEIGMTDFCRSGGCHQMGWEKTSSNAQISNDLAKSTWRDYLKFTFVQEPLVRIVAGFLNRLYFRYPGGLGEEAIFRITRPHIVAAEFGRKSYWSMPENKPTLEELFRYLTQVVNPKTENRHWMPQFFIWPFCQEDHFDFIGKVDDLACGMEHLARNFSGQSQVPKFFVYENRMSAEKRANLLRAVPPELVQKVIMKHYLLDYNIFGFELPDFDKWNSTVNRLFGITT